MPEHIVFKIARNRFVRISTLIFLAIVGAGLLRAVYTISQKRGIVAERKTVLEAERVKNQELTARLQEATSAGFVERVARDKLGLVRSGETVIIMDRTQNPRTNDQKKPQDLPSWKQWWKLFF